MKRLQIGTDSLLTTFYNLSETTNINDFEHLEIQTWPSRSFKVDDFHFI